MNLKRVDLHKTKELNDLCCRCNIIVSELTVMSRYINRKFIINIIITVNKLLTFYSHQESTVAVKSEGRLRHRDAINRMLT